ncbi:MAG: hypothetical protein QHI48_00200 [Bacteroidota bacterium]|nr:hypothetical protein [Bacteroidota bacterium]
MPRPLSKSSKESGERRMLTGTRKKNATRKGIEKKLGAGADLRRIVRTTKYMPSARVAVTAGCSDIPGRNSRLPAYTRANNSTTLAHRGGIEGFIRMEYACSKASSHEVFIHTHAHLAINKM